MPTIELGGKTLQLGPKNFVGQGGEAEIYRIPGNRSVKLFKGPRHVDFKGRPAEQEGARRRLELMQTKLPAFPKGLPPRVVAPIELVRDKNGKIIGHVMPFIDDVELLKRLGERSFREQQNIGIPEVLTVFADLHSTVDGVHRAGAVIGDFNDLNVLYKHGQAWLIDADSMQWGKFPCIAYTQAFVDPLLCEPTAATLQLIHPHTAESDWYAFAIMLMRSLLYVGPYGGVYKPKRVGDRVAAPLRPLHNITVFNPEVVYPKPALPLSELPTDLREYFQEVFEHDKREAFPLNLLDYRLWSHPGVRVVVLQPAKSVHGTVTATVVFETSGRIVMADMQGGKLRVLHHHDGAYLREDGAQVIKGAYDPHMRYRLNRDKTLFAKASQLIVMDGQPTQHHVDSFGGLPMFDATDHGYYWLDGGVLKRSDQLVGQRPIGDVLPGRSLMWAGDIFGFGLWYAGELQQAYVFDARSAGINSTVQIDRIPGQLINAKAVFGGNQAWFLVEYQDQGRTHHRCVVVNKTGQVLAEVTVSDPQPDHWLYNIHGHAALDRFMFCATDEGVVAVRIENGNFVTTLFPDTAPFVDSESRLLAFTDAKQVALMVVSDQQVVRLSINP